jgi:hypothetical protein
MKEVRVRG